MANAFKSIAKYIRRNGDCSESEILKDLCTSLEENTPFELGRLFDMRGKAFALALEVIEEWRFDRHVAGRRLQKYLDETTD